MPAAMRVLLAITLTALVLPGAGRAGTVFLLGGGGWGHGVGMSQWGAEGYARHGSDYKQILAHYYPHTTLTVAQPKQVRVLLAQGQATVRVGSAAPFVVVDAVGRTLHLPARSVVLDRRFMLRHLKLHAPLRFEPGAQPLQVDLAGYRGDIVVKSKPGGLMVVNELPLDRYLRGVIPSEIPNGWHEATYEAQAVAARSYTLATLHPGADFDLYSDDRSQVYGGIAAEEPWTNLAVGATAGQVLTWDGQIITAYYFSSSGGRTSSVHDEWPNLQQVPYLVSVRDPYDGISPHHVWPTKVLTAAQIGSMLGLSDVRDAVVVENASGHAAAMRVLSASGWTRYSGQTIETKFNLDSTDFDLRAMTLDSPASSSVYETAVHVHGWVRGLGKARLEELTGSGWQTVAHVHPQPNGQFASSVQATRSTELRLAYNGLAGDPVSVQVAPRIQLQAQSGKLRVLVAPRLPLQVERLTRDQWQPVAHSTGTFDQSLRPGSYRVAVSGGSSYLSSVSAPVGLHVRATGP